MGVPVVSNRKLARGCQSRKLQARGRRRIAWRHEHRRNDWYRQAKDNEAWRNGSVAEDSNELHNKDRKPVKPKRSTKKGDAREKLVAAFTAHHQYDRHDDRHISCLNWTPIGNNELARNADVSKGSAKAFFDKFFGEEVDAAVGAPGSKKPHKKKNGHKQYQKLCRRNTKKVLNVLKALNGDFVVHDSYDDLPPDEKRP